MKLMLAISSLGLFSAAATAVPASNVRLQYEYFEKGISICSGEQRVSFGDKYLFCDRTTAGERILVKLATKTGAGNGIVSGEVEHIDRNGKIISAYRPQIAFLSGEASSIAVGENGLENYRLDVTATVLKSK